jgi:outer membrane protein OmpA-like peptidoglycan-associated protein
VHTTVIARAGCHYKCTILRLVTLFSILAIALTGCASSNVSRDAASNVDMGLDNANKLGTNFADGDVVESYQNSSQRSKGAMLGGAVGAVAGVASSSVAVIPGAMVGMILGATYGSYIDSQSSVADQLTNRGATIIELGDQLLVVIPSARIFEGMTDKIKPPAYSTLNLLAAYINQYPNTLVKISAYTDDIGEKSINLALSKQQAAKVVHYLTADKVNTRVLYAEGFGGTNLVMKNTEEWGKSDNYRLEVTLEKLDV